MRALLLALLLVAGTARAEKQRHTASLLSGAGAAVSSGLVVLSFLIPTGEINYPLFGTGLALSVVTPSLGELYAGQYLTIGEGVRAAAAGAALYAIATQNESIRCEDGNGFCKSITGTGVAILGLAAIAFVGGVAYDLLDAPDAVDRYNRRLGIFVSMAKTPEGSVPTLAFGGRF